jgi:very-short-patch-repair endonuclease
VKPGRAADHLVMARLRDRSRFAARRLRGDQTDAEDRLWYHLRDRRLKGWKFRRQHPVAPYVADFCCLEAMLIVEVDGSQHAEDEAAYDRARTAHLERHGFRVIRFWNEEVLQETDDVLRAIRRALKKVPSP